MKFQVLLLIVFILLSFGTTAQTETTSPDTTITDTLDVENWESWEKDKKDKFDFEFVVFDDEFRGSPTIYFSFGMAKIEHKNLGYEFADPKSLELKLGNTFQSDYKKDGRILKYRFSSLFISNVTTELSSEDDINKLKSESWRFGTARSTGYGYKLGQAAIIPYNSNSFIWTRLDADESLANIDGLTPLIDRYNNSFRFGNSFEGGVKFQFIRNLALDAAYERTAVYERHLFWKWSGSFMIEVISQALVDEFVEAIIESSPMAGPVVNFILKNGLSYGIYELKKDKMNWPFSSEPALMYDQFKLGLTFVF